MYLIGITEEDYETVVEGELGCDKNHGNVNARPAVKTVQKHAVSALAGYMYTIKRDPTVKAIADSLFPRKKAVTPA